MGNIKETDKIYFPPEMVNFAYCVAVLAVILNEHPKAQDLYQHIKDCMKLPGVAETFNTVERKTPGSDKLIKVIVKKAGYVSQDSLSENPALVFRKLILGTNKLTASLKNRFLVPVLLNNRKRGDFNTLLKSVDTFIRVCCNRESEKTKGKYRITIRSSRTLANCIIAKAFIDANEKYREIFSRLGKLNEQKFTIRERTDLSSNYLAALFIRKHDKKMDNTAWRWYQCRVVYNGTKAFCVAQMNRPNIKDRENLDSSNISNDIKDFDDALGYKRQKTGKHKI